MKYRMNSYRDSFLAAVKGKSDSESKRITKNFLAILIRDKSFSKINEIMRAIHLEHLKRLGRKEIHAHSPSTLDSKTKKELHAIFGKDAHIKETVDPELLGGVKLLVDDEILIDSTAKRWIDEMFNKKRA
jgi:F0F1-type ATP synthase delta subunit